MEQVELYLGNIWFFLLGLILALYVVLDGFDLGLGILSLFSTRQGRRSMMMASLGTVWDANETWLVLFGGALFGAFPRAYGVVLNALYLPFLAMLAGLTLRGVAFEFHEHSRRKTLWDRTFGLGSLLAAASQGCILGGLLGGIKVRAPATFAGGPVDWVTPFTLMIALGVVSGYTMLGATYLVMKTSGPAQRQFRRQAQVAAFVSVGLAGATVIAMSFIHAPIAERWTSRPHLYYFIVIFACTLAAFAALIRSLRRRHEVAPFAWSIVVFLLTLLGAWLGIYPYLVPTSVTLFDASSTPATQVFMLAGIGLLIPVIMTYNGYVYLVFRGKVTAEETEDAGGETEY